MHTHIAICTHTYAYICIYIYVCVCVPVYVWSGLVWFYIMARQSLEVIQCQIHFYLYKQFYFKQFSLAKVLSLVLFDL